MLSELYAEEGDGEIVPLVSEEVKKNESLERVKSIEKIVPPENVTKTMKVIDGQQREVIEEFIGPKNMKSKYISDGDDFD